MANSVEIDPSPDPQPPIRPWSSLLIRDYRLLWIASVLSSLAGQIRNVATLYQVYDISGSAFKLGLTGFLETLPFIIFGLFAGAGRAGTAAAVTTGGVLLTGTGGT